MKKKINKEFTQLQKWKIESLIDKYTVKDEKNEKNRELEKIEVSDKTAYIDDQGNEYNGLIKDYKFKINNKDIFVFDNHNKVLFPIVEYYWNKGEIKLDIVHIDAHKDDAKIQFLEPEKLDKNNINKYYKMTRISDYLDLLIKTKVVNNIFSLTQSKDFLNFRLSDLDKNDYILNLDIDIFGPDGEMVDLELKIKTIIKVWKKAKYVVIATSPGFINQNNGVFLINYLLKKV